MKKLNFALLIIVSLLLLVACSPTQIAGYNENMTEQDFFDFSKAHKPKLDDIEKIVGGMSLKEAISLIGKPHEFGPTSGVLTLIWEAENGDSYLAYVRYGSEGQKSESFYYSLYENGTIMMHPVAYDP